MHLLLQSGIFPMKEFKDWEITTNKSWTSLKLFIHGVYQHRLMTVGLQNTLAQQGYSPTHGMYATLADGSDSDDGTTTGMQTTTLVTTGSTLRNTYAMPVQATAQVTTSPELALAINLLAANQQALPQHIAVMSFHAQPSLEACMFPAPHTMLFHVLPI